VFKVALTGRLGGDAELRTSKAGKPFLSLNVATGSGEQTTWVRTTVFGDRAIELASALKKGSSVYVTGRFQIDKWIGRDGAERTGFSVVAGEVQLCEIGRQRSRKREPKATAAQPAKTNIMPQNAHARRDGLDDDIPF
jgi:single-strand DNA-binding protein